MPDLKIHRDHSLGLPEARRIAQDWVRSAQDQWHMACTYEVGETLDRITFTRSGLSGELRVGADHFTLDAKLGFLLGAFKERIEQEVSKNLDELLTGTGSGPQDQR